MSVEAWSKVVLAFDVGPTKCAYAKVAHILQQPGVTARFRCLEHGMCASQASEMLAVLEHCGPVDLVAIEHAVHTHPDRAASRQALMGRSKQLMATTRVEGVLDTLCLTKQLPTVLVPATQWRRALTGKAQADSNRIAHFVKTFVAGMPKKCNEHHRDAIGLAVVAPGFVVTSTCAAWRQETT